MSTTVDPSATYGNSGQSLDASSPITTSSADTLSADKQSVPLMMEPMGELDGAINSLAVSAKYNLTQMSPKQLLFSRWAVMKSWGSFVDTNRMQFPTAISQWSRRLVRNLQHFQSNYMCVFIILFIYCILTSPLLLLALSASFGAAYILTLKNAERPLKFFGRRLTLGQQYLCVAVVSLPLFYIVGAGSAVFWVIGASLFVIGLHASIYAIESVDTDSLDGQPFNYGIQSV
ncbi:prenylated Rab acceptor protein 1-like [Oppia nitens]|uniref:prenylated Rab acceptor protein 1-like n=1 Tax=Oppia nitens TaxID=1686743 RepID=UPI0023DA9FEB|nr:prenylated Rab acceptor protein 1-like [Oppia nitens]